MAYIYGSPGRDDIAATCSGRKAILLRIALPLLFLFVLASAGLHAFLLGSYFLTAISVIFFVFLLLRFEELGLTLAQRLSGAEAKARTDRMVAKTLRLLPEGYHVFHDLELGGLRIDHAVVGPNGFFPVMNRTNLGRITEVRDSLRLNGLPFLRDVVSLAWRRSQTLLRQLDIGHSGDLQVCPVLCFSRAGVDAGRLMRGVMITQTSTLVRLILEHESSLGSEKILKLTDKLAPMVRVKTAEPEVTHQEVMPGAADDRHTADSRRPACRKCHHVPSDLEAELFPDECPRCGRLHSATAVEESTPTLPGAPRTSAAALATASLVVAAGSALLVYQAGLFDPDWPADAAPAPAHSAVDAAPPAPGLAPPPAAPETPGPRPPWPRSTVARPASRGTGTAEAADKRAPAAAAAAPQSMPDMTPAAPPLPPRRKKMPRRTRPGKPRPRPPPVPPRRAGPPTPRLRPPRRTRARRPPRPRAPGATPPWAP
jgi:hypothetical protein